MPILFAVVVLLVFLGPLLSAGILKRLGFAIFIVLFFGGLWAEHALGVAPDHVNDAVSPGMKIAIAGAVIGAVLRGIAWIIDPNA